ncbi:hypothetical protein Trydic_g20978 [Trypoxylus dichotomus]
MVSKSSMKMLAIMGDSGDPTGAPSVCLYLWYVKRLLMGPQTGDACYLVIYNVNISEIGFPYVQQKPVTYIKRPHPETANGLIKEHKSEKATDNLLLPRLDQKSTASLTIFVSRPAFLPQKPTPMLNG